MFSDHAIARMQQRSIPIGAIDALLDYGEHHRHRGADIFFLTKSGRCRMIRDLGKRAFLNLEKALDTYLVVSDDGCVITAGRRYRRLKF